MSCASSKAFDISRNKSQTFVAGFKFYWSVLVLSDLSDFALVFLFFESEQYLLSSSLIFLPLPKL